METKNPIYLEVKEKKILKGGKLDFLNYLCLFGPCSTNELIEEVKKNKLITDPMDLNKLNRHPSVLKGMNLIKVHSHRKCRASKSKKEVEILEIVDEFTGIIKKPKGKTLKILQSSINAALLAVEIYNKPRTTFRTESYISLMVNAWTKLFHAYFRLTEGDIYFYQKATVEGKEIQKTWDLSKCIKHYKSLSKPVAANLEMFIGLRNDIEHGLVDESSVDVSIFGECQALLFNYENFIINKFGEDYALNESIAFSLQFSMMRDPNQNMANKQMLSKEAKDVVEYLNKYRGSLSADIFNSQEFSIKLIQVPRVSNTDRADFAIKFVKYDELDEEDKEQYNVIDALIKKQVEKVSVLNEGLLKPMMVVEAVNNQVKDLNINAHDLLCLYSITEVRPLGQQKTNTPDLTNSKFCIYDQVNKDYLYTKKWVSLIVALYTKKKYTIEKIRLISKELDSEESLKIKKYSKSFS